MMNAGDQSAVKMDIVAWLGGFKLGFVCLFPNIPCFQVNCVSFLLIYRQESCTDRSNVFA